MAKIKALLDNIVFSHSIFALPFAYIGSILAAGGIPTGHDLFWITLAMVGARSAAMALNNFIDLKYDRLQPRFAKRPMVTGEVKPKEAVLFIIFSLALFLWAAANLNPLCLKLAPLALIPLSVYPYMKRFSWTCHLVLGIALGVAPVGAWVAIRGSVDAPVVLLGVAVCVWIGAFDIIYGCQDVEFDKRNGLHSMPERFGVANAIIISRLLHVASVAMFIWLGELFALKTLYYCGVALAAAVLFYQHSIVSANDLSRVRQDYFMRNGMVGIALLLFTLASVVI